MKARRMLALILIVLLALFALVVWMADGLQTPHAFDSPPVKLDAVTVRTSTSARELTIVSWNIAWGYGWGSEGTGSYKQQEHFDRSLEQMIQILVKLDPDVVLLQEVDFDCTRSHHQDQAALLAKGASLPHVAYAVSWRANWVPFPYWPPRDHYGRMSSGGAILSKHPISSHRVELLPKPEENPFWYNLFYLFRYYQHAEIEVFGESVPVVNTHLEAFRSANRQAQASLLANALSSLDDRHLLFGGDLNSPPEEATLRAAYPDEPKTSHQSDRTIALLRAVEDLHDSVPWETFSRKETDWHTFPSHEPNRKLDYLFYGSGWELIDVRVLREAGTVSDHLPLVARVRMR